MLEQSKKEDRIIKIKKEDFLDICSNSGIENFFPRGDFEYRLEEDITAVSLSIVDKDGQRWFYYKLRDRSFDGPQWFPTPLTSWLYNNPSDQFNLGSAVERSRYWGDPNTPLSLCFSYNVATFIINPFEQLPFDNPSEDRLKDWIERWQYVFFHPDAPFPGQFSLNSLNGLSSKIFENTVSLLQANGYQYLTSVPTWLHVALSNLDQGFKFYNPDDERRINAILDQLPHQTLEERKKTSWITLLQFWAELAEKNGINPTDFIDSQFILRDKQGKILTYPLSPRYNLWQIYQI